MTWTRPDWRCINAYPVPDFTRTSRRQFGWQFLRRNLLYGECWDAANYDYSSAVLPMDLTAEQRSRLFVRRFGLRKLIDPGTEWRSDLEQEFSGSVLLYCGDPNRFELEVELQPYECALLVDLREPLESLMDALRRRLELQRKAEKIKSERSRIQPRDLVQYLRILDAFDSEGDSFECKDVAISLIPDVETTGWRKRLRKALEQAEMFRQYRYRELIRDSTLSRKSRAKK